MLNISGDLKFVIEVDSYKCHNIGIKHCGSFTIAIEIGLQNSALAIFIATQVLESEEMALMAFIYSSFTFFTTLGIAYMLKEHITHVQLFRNILIKINGKRSRH